jgi:hypothetical protein
MHDKGAACPPSNEDSLEIDFGRDFLSTVFAVSRPKNMFTYDSRRLRG